MIAEIIERGQAMTKRDELLDPKDDELISVRVRNSEDIRQDIAARRAVIATTVDQLGDRVNQTLDWRTHASNHPLAAVGVAAAAGFFLSRIFRPRLSPSQRLFESLADGVEDTKKLMRLIVGQPVGHTVGAVARAAVTAAITKAAANYVSDQLARTDSQRNSMPHDQIYRQREHAEPADVANRVT
jgi:hypothetical protein